MNLRFNQTIYTHRDKNGKLNILKEGQKKLQVKEKGFGWRHWRTIDLDTDFIEIINEDDLKYYE